MTLRKRELVEASAELDAALDWYAEKRALIAVEFFDAVLASVDHILAWPDSGRSYAGRENRVPVVRTLPVRGFPYSIVYFVDGDDLVISAYTHHRQRPGYWMQRLDQ